MVHNDLSRQSAADIVRSPSKQFPMKVIPPSDTYRISTVVIDTGSNVLLLPQSNCSNCSPEQSKFNPAISSTFSWPSNSSSPGDSDPWFSTGVDTIPFAEPQPAFCNWAVDDVSMQGLAASRFSFLLCYDEAPVLSSMPGIDGVLGLSLNGSGTFQWALYEAGLVDSGIFGMYMPPGQVNGGQLTLGGVDETKFEGDLTWVSLNQGLAAEHGQWVVNMQTIFVNGKQLQVLDPSANDSSPNSVPYAQSLVQVLDTGTSFIMAPDNATAAALYAQISPKIFQIDSVGTWGCSCEDMEAIIKAGAQISFLLGYSNQGQQLNLTLPSSVFNLGPYPGSPELCQAVVNNWSEGVFYNGTVGLWTLGSTLLKNYYTAWDGLNLRVGFAPLSSPKTRCRRDLEALASAAQLVTRNLIGPSKRSREEHSRNITWMKAGLSLWLWASVEL